MMRISGFSWAWRVSRADGVGTHLGDFSRHQVPILTPGIVTGVKNLDSGDLDHEHGGAKHVPGIIGLELDALIAICVMRNINSYHPCGGHFDGS